MNSRQFVIISFVFCLLNCACFGQDSSLAPSDDVHRQVVCIWETFNAECGQNKVLLIVEAFLGRMRIRNSCSIELGSGELPCFADIQLVAERRCSGRRQCSFKPIDDDLQSFPGNCSHRAEMFLVIAYRCQEVYSADNETCFGNRSLVVTSSSGYLSNTVTEESGKGLSLCPWKFQLREGQTVTLTLLDFGVWQGRGEPSGDHTCRIYASIRHLQPNSQAPANIPICGGNERERLIQSTKTSLEVLMTTPDNQSSANKVYFLIRFQTFECPEIDAPLGANVEKSREGFRIYCDDDRQRSLDLRCEAGHWIPEINLTCPTFSIDPLASSPAYFSPSTSSSYSEFSPTEVESLKDSSSISWEKYLVGGGLLLLALVVVIIVVVMYRNRRIDRKHTSGSCVTPIADNAYYSGQLLIGEIYEEIEDSNLPQIPECSSSDSVTGTKINCTLPRSRNDPHLAGRSLEQNPDALKGQPPYPHQYTDTSADTYLVPREEERSSTFQPFTNKLIQNETFEII